LNEHEWQEIIGTIGIFGLLTSVIVTIIWQTAITWRAKAQLARESEYKALAEAAAAGQQRIERQLAEVSGQLAGLQSRTESMERVLKDVE
jgi:hypothetical protein